MAGDFFGDLSTGLMENAKMLVQRAAQPCPNGITKVQNDCQKEVSLNAASLLMAGACLAEMWGRAEAQEHERIMAAQKETCDADDDQA